MFSKLPTKGRAAGSATGDPRGLGLPLHPQKHQGVGMGPTADSWPGVTATSPIQGRETAMESRTRVAKRKVGSAGIRKIAGVSSALSYMRKQEILEIAKRLLSQMYG